MITLQSGETDKIIVTESTPTPPTPVDPEPTPDPEEIVGNINVTYNAMDGSIIERNSIFIKRNMLGTSINVSPSDNVIADIDSFTVTPTTVQVTQTSGNTLSIQIPTEVLDQDIELIVTMAMYGR
jgi:hypothetical protein